MRLVTRPSYLIERRDVAPAQKPVFGVLVVAPLPPACPPTGALGAPHVTPGERLESTAPGPGAISPPATVWVPPPFEPPIVVPLFIVPDVGVPQLPRDAVLPTLVGTLPVTADEPEELAREAREPDENDDARAPVPVKVE
jgi:hypothetical protein